ncbi:BatA domain-containing protein [Dyadobacter chenwenxiniae]|uniref:BatA domain-containing protein n=1 Tax=Dyadobacter chenwenxiniae TaxID=2906456 RepID=A0A9X1TCK9_9BACT|nr:BatA domain-containing protein [Dyadobacter chenwenxiniae]MCF0060192.1 BatA domain-containing protein [Dyadobacter chenwenxiniae]UON85929.1 BatA domain-containing protein [Dyadobacter chenwenxiniae]
MEFLNPYMLWGLLAVALPVIIHFWYQKKGKQIAWAASQWLIDKTALQHRGIRLDEIPLLLIRCLLVVLLAMLLSRPVLNWFGKDIKKEEAHLVQADHKVVSNFRFEIESALKREEKVIWIGAGLKPLTDIASIPEERSGLASLQRSVNSTANDNTHLNLYLNNSQEISHLPKILIPGTYKLNVVRDSSRKLENPLSGLARKLGKTNINVLIDYRNPDESRTVQAGLEALRVVFKIPFHIDLKIGSRNQYDWIFTDKPITKPNAQTLYVVPEGNMGDKVFENIIQVSDSLRLATSDIVQNGQLPEWLGEMLIEHYDLEENTNPLSGRQLNAAFGRVKPGKGPLSDGLHQWLLLLFLLTLILERWISLNQSISRKYA